MSNITISQEHKDAFLRKQLNCKSRMIDFNFTMEEFDAFLKLKKKVCCAYTGKPFVIGRAHNNNPTIERIDNHKPYSPANCVWVTDQVNGLKARYIENEESMKGIAESSIFLIQRVKKILNNPEAFAAMMKPYHKAYAVVEEDKIEQAKVKAELEEKLRVDKITAEAAQEREISKSFYTFSNMLSQCGVALEMSYAQYRRKLLSKTCRLTGQELPSSLDERTFFVVDKTKPVNKDNVKVTTKILAEALDTFITSAKVDAKCMAKIAKEMK